MMKQLNPHDIFEIAKATGRSPSEVMDIAQGEGWEITNDAHRQTPPKVQGSVMSDPAGAVKLMRELREKSTRELYRNDPIVRESLDVQAAFNAGKSTTNTKSSNLNYDEHGNLAGIKSSVVSGVNATCSNQTDLMRAIKANLLKNYGLSE